jgi:hypothetical protein
MQVSKGSSADPCFLSTPRFLLLDRSITEDANANRFFRKEKSIYVRAWVGSAKSVSAISDGQTGAMRDPITPDAATESGSLDSINGGPFDRTETCLEAWQ